MLIIGLTGGVGSGKSTVADLFKTYHVPIIDADVIAREITMPDKDEFKKIISHFGDQILKNDGTLDRKKLREIIFTHSSERVWLENLLHPTIRKHIEQQLQETSAPYVIVIIPLLFETGSYPFLDRILLVDAHEETQIKRVLIRDQADEKQVSAMLKAQISREERLKRSHDVIANDGLLSDLAPQVEKLHEFYLALSKKNCRD